MGKTLKLFTTSCSVGTGTREGRILQNNFHPCTLALLCIRINLKKLR